MNIEKINVGGNLYDICDAKVRAMVSDEYNTGKEYVEGDICIQDNKLYRAKGATTGVWDSTKWEEKPLAEIIREQNSNFAKILFSGTAVNSKDYNELKSGIYYLGTNCTNAPEGYCRVLCLYSGESSITDDIQIAFAVSSLNIYIRKKESTSWSAWKKFVGTNA